MGESDALTDDYGAPNDTAVDLDKLGPITFNESAPLPTLARRMSSQLSLQFERQTSVLGQSGVAGYIPDSIASHIPGFGRQPSLRTTYFCNICFTHYPTADGFKLRNCQHTFCVECIKGFFTNKINNGSIYLKCFHPVAESDQKPCQCDIDEHDIHQLVDRTTWEKYEKFKSNLENTLSRQCPYCDNTQIGDKSTSKITCDNAACGKEYCLSHSNAHPMDEDCESYENRTRKENKLNEMALQEMGDGVKPCPQCEFRIMKNGGCNHMKCVKCGCSFCWLCMEQIEDTELPNHYKDENSKCKGQQFADGENAPLCMIVVMGCVMCIFCVPSLALGCVFGCLCQLCIVFCVGEKDILETICMCTVMWMMLPAVIVLFVFVIIWSGIKSAYDNIKYLCPCLPTCPESWIDTMHAQQMEPQLPGDNDLDINGAW
eukprot:303661_1